MQITRKLIAFSLTTSTGIATAVNSVLAAGETPATGSGVSGRIGVGLNLAAKNSGYMEGQTDLPTLVGNLINQGFSILGVLLLGLLLYGGILWMTAAGEQDRVKKAISVIRNAIIGLVIIVVAYALANFIVSALGTATQGTPTQ
ncbi:MAG: hypothetical protein WC551_06725 [Patescibacteria group bacterium]